MMMSDNGHVLQARDLHFAYRSDQQVLQGVSFSASTGKLSCILGPNGSGKTTLLRCLLRQLKIDKGEILLDFRPLETYSARMLARMIAYVPQFPTSAFAFTVGQVVMLGRTPHLSLMGFESDLDHRVARASMEMTGVGHLSDRMLSELSGGEAQCVMIARAIAQQPQVLLLDEPTSHLDVKNQLSIYSMLVRVAHDWPMAVICVSHDINLASRFADELLLMREGRVVAQGPPEEVIQREMLQMTYDVDVEIVNTPRGVPVVVVHQ